MKLTPWLKVETAKVPQPHADCRFSVVQQQLVEVTMDECCDQTIIKCIANTKHRLTVELTKYKKICLLRIGLYQV